MTNEYTNIKPELFDEIIEYINFANKDRLVAKKFKFLWWESLTVKVTKLYIYRAKELELSKSDIKKQVDFHVENVIMKFTEDVNWIYKNNLEFKKHMDFKIKMENRKKAIEKLLKS